MGLIELKELESFRLNFSDGSLLVLNLCIAFIMFSVALSLKTEHFTMLVKKPRSMVIGLVSQLLILPLLTLLIILLFDISLSIGLGMILVSVCPGGNVSNFYTMMAKGNTALSVSLTAIVTCLSIFSIPYFFGLWSGLVYNEAAEISLEVSVTEMVTAVFLVMGIPLIIGILFATRFPDITRKVQKPAKWVSYLILIGFLAFAVAQNVNAFAKYAGDIFLIVVGHNLVSFSGAYLWATLMKCPKPDRKSITIETGIQNATIAFGLVFAFFGGNGAMAIVAGMWGIWHLIAGAGLAAIFSRQKESA